jgi:prepilin-type N-terminal cleavage/methylation domain-containing protein
MKTKGFTLIELLVVIAIIGILSSVVLASLNTARAKGTDAAIKSNISSARAQAELFYDNSSAKEYGGVCATAGGIGTMKIGAENAGSASVLCVDDADEWAMSAQLKTSSLIYCVDSSGVATTSTLTAQTVDLVTSCQ